MKTACATLIATAALLAAADGPARASAPETRTVCAASAWVERAPADHPIGVAYRGDGFRVDRYAHTARKGIWAHGVHRDKDHRRGWVRDADLCPWPAGRRREPFGPAGAMRAGIRAFAGDAPKTTASRIAVTCAAIPRVGDVGRCRGTFRLTRAGRTADYRLTAKAATFRNTPHSIEYRLYARTAHPVRGVARSTGLLGFLGDGSGKA